MPTRIGRLAASSKTSEDAAVIRPVQHCLALPPPAVDVSLVAMLPNGRDVPRDATPPPDLSRIVARPAAHVVPAVPLEPAARVMPVDPAPATPLGQGLRGVDAEAVQAW